MMPGDVFEHDTILCLVESQTQKTCLHDLKLLARMPGDVFEHDIILCLVEGQT